MALAFLLAQVASQVHRAEAAHRLCAEHGALEHVHGLDGHARAASGRDATIVRAGPVDERAPDSGAHEACELAQLLHVPQAGAPTEALSPCAAPPGPSPAAPEVEARPREVRGRAESARGPPSAA